MVYEDKRGGAVRRALSDGRSNVSMIKSFQTGATEDIVVPFSVLTSTRLGWLACSFVIED